MSPFSFIFLIRSLRTKIPTLETTVQMQNQTLAVMEKRISETEKVGQIYKDLLNGLPQDLDNYKAVISKTKDEVILELQNSNKQKEQRLRAIEERALQQPQSPTSSGPHLAAMRFLLEAQNESFRKFVIEMCGDIDVAVDALVRAADFDSLLAAERKTLIIEDDKEKWEALVKPKNREANGMRSANWSMNGWHAFLTMGGSS